MNPPNKDTLKLSKQLAYGGGLVMLFGLFGYVVSFVLNVIIARYLGPKDYGMFQLALSVVTIVTLLVSVGFNQLIHTYIPRYIEDNKPSLILGLKRYVLLMEAILSGAALIGLVFVFPLFHSVLSIPSVVIELTKAMALLVPFRLFSGYCRYNLYARKIIGPSSLHSSVGVPLIRLVGVVVMVVLGMSLKYIAIAYTFATLVALLVDIVIYQFFAKKIAAHPKYDLKEWVRFSVVIYLSVLLVQIIPGLNNLLIGYLLSSSAVGIFVIAFSIAAFIEFFQQMFINIYVPLVSSEYEKRNFPYIQVLHSKVREWVLYLSIPVVGLFLVNAKMIIIILFGADYVDSAALLQVLSVGFLVNVAMGLNDYLLNATDRITTTFVVNLVMLMLHIILLWYSVVTFGLIGAALALSATMIVRNTLFYFAVKRAIPIQMLDRKSVKLYIVSVVVLIGYAFVYSIVPHDSFMVAMLLGIMYGALQIYVMFIAKVFDNYDLELFYWVKSVLAKQGR